jgi:hypothetical protein
MALHLFVFVFLLVVCLIISLALLWRLDWFPLRPASSQGAAKRTMLPRLLKPRTPDDCPACRLASTASSAGEPAPVPIRPWSEVKSRRGAPKRVNTAGYACPNQQCKYFGNTDDQFHALVGDGKHGKAECIQTFRCQACRTTFTPPAQHSFISPENPFPASRRGALSAGRGAGSFGGRAGLWLSTRHNHHLVDSRWRTRTNVAQAVLLPSAPATHPARRTPHQAAQPYAGAVALASHRSPHENSSCPACGSPHPKRSTSGHSLAATDAGPRLSSALYERRVKSLLLRPDGPFWRLAPGASSRQEHASVAGGGGPDLRPGEEKLPATEAGPGLARDASWHRGRSHRYFTGTGFLWTAQYRFYRTGESDRAPWDSRSGPPDLGHSPAGPTAASPPRVVASLLPFCPSSRSAAGEARAAAKPWWQAGGATLSAADTCDGCRQNTSTMDSQGGALMPFAAAFRLRGSQARWGAVSCPRKMGEGIRRQTRIEPHSRKRRPLWTASSPKTGPKWVCSGLVDLSTISNRSTLSF